MDKSRFVGMSFGFGAGALIGVFWKEICDTLTSMGSWILEDRGR